MSQTFSNIISGVSKTALDLSDILIGSKARQKGMFLFFSPLCFIYTQKLQQKKKQKKNGSTQNMYQILKSLSSVDWRFIHKFTQSRFFLWLDFTVSKFMRCV